MSPGDKTGMAEFLTTTGISHKLEEIIRNAEEQLWIISPFLKINQQIKERLEDRSRSNIDIRVIYGKNDLQPEEKKWLDSMNSIQTFYRRNLHAKCYLNEKEALLTSMNLYEFSQVNNDEMGILVSKDQDHDLYHTILEESKRIWRFSEGSRETVATVNVSDDPPESPKRRMERATVDKPQNGFCIRCKTTIPANPGEPYCASCFRTWNRFKNPDYKEQHCHTCGTDTETTKAKPVCLSCHRKYRGILEFAAV